MRKLLIFAIGVVTTLSVIAQERGIVNSAVKNLTVTVPAQLTDDFVPAQQNPTAVVKSSLSLPFTQVGVTQYDNMTNSAVDHRIVLFPDGTIGLTFTYGTGSFADRGTGYAYFDGTSWSAQATSRIESLRTGWPSYSSLGANGEIVVAHNADSLTMSTRATKGTGAWVETPLGATTAGVSPTWPRIATSGNTIHLLAGDYNNTVPVLYWRSTDGGATWDIQGEQIAGFSTAEYPKATPTDAYAWAEPMGDTIAFVIGDKMTDLVLMKSLDGGDSWASTVIFQHPYPDFDETTTYLGDGVNSTDTPYVCDASMAVALDDQGVAHVAFGVTRFINIDLTDGSYSYFPGVDGIAFWKEGDATFTSANPDDIDASGKLIGYTLDLNGSGVAFDDYSSLSDGFPSYGVSISSQPQLSFDANGTLYFAFKMANDTMNNGAFYFSQIWTRKLVSGSTTWSDFSCLNTGLDFDLTECVYPAMAKNVDDQIHLWFMFDGLPGTLLGEDQTIGDNYIIYMGVDTASIGDPTLSIDQHLLSNQMEVYPNPSSDVINLSFSGKISSDYRVDIINTLGSVVSSFEFKYNGTDVLPINISNLPTGVYMVQVTGDNIQASQKIIKN